MNDRDFPLKNETYSIIGAAMEVHKTLGCGFLEAVYQEALEIEFKNQQIPYNREVSLNICYKDEILKKHYLADFVCFDKIIIELKALVDLSTENEAQVLNYLKATRLHVGLLLNFGAKSLQYRRIITEKYF